MKKVPLLSQSRTSGIEEVTGFNEDAAPFEAAPAPTDGERVFKMSCWATVVGDEQEENNKPWENNLLVGV